MIKGWVMAFSTAERCLSFKHTPFRLLRRATPRSAAAWGEQLTAAPPPPPTPRINRSRRIPKFSEMEIAVSAA